MSDPEFVPTHKFPTVKRPLKRQNGGTMEINQVNNSYYAGGVQGTAGTASAGQTTDEYLRGLEQKYGVHITVGNDSGFEDYMWGAGKGGNVYIPRNIAEKMASDEAYAAKYEKLISEEPENSRHMQEYCDSHNMILYGTGMQIHEDGSVTWWIEVFCGGRERDRTPEKNRQCLSRRGFGRCGGARTGPGRSDGYIRLKGSVQRAGGRCGMWYKDKDKAFWIKTYVSG